MPSIEVVKQHSLGAMQAKAKINQYLAQQCLLGEVRSLTWRWTGFNAAISFAIDGTMFNGTLAVTEHTVEIEGPIPLLAFPFRGRIETELRAKLDKALE